MSVTRKSALFLLLTFAISWSAVLAGHFAGLKQGLGAIGVLVVMMAGPAIAALICAFQFERGRIVEALGLRFRPNWWWLIAWAIPVALAALSVGATLLLSDRTYVDMGAAARQAAEAQGQDLSQVPPLLLSTPFIVLMSITLGALINAPILTFTEELGWRGYLHFLWRPSGFWRAALGTGLVWGLWHAPAIYLYGLNYPTEPLLGAGLFTVFCMLLSTVMTLVRDRGGSVWAAGILHGAFNAVGGLTLAMVSQPTFPWNGIVGVGGFVALTLACIGVALARMSEKSPAAAG